MFSLSGSNLNDSDLERIINNIKVTLKSRLLTLKMIKQTNNTKF